MQGTLRKKRLSMLTFAVLLLSFSFAIVTLSLTESIRTTNDGYRQSTFGGWYLAILDGWDEDAAWLAQQSWAEDIGKVRIYGTVMRTASSGEPQTFGTVDETFLFSPPSLPPCSRYFLPCRF